MPTISRPILIALVVSVVAAVAFYATQGGDGATEAAAPVIPTTPAVDDGSQPAPQDAAEHASPDGASAGKGDRASASERDASEPRDARRGVPAPVRRALAGGKLVVLFFYERRAADDRATARGVSALRRQPNTAVFSDPIARIARYRGVTGDLGVSQAPAIVLVGRKRTARVIEGYIDPATLAQDVADAR